jgi:uncharacterized delta-60 repeat protein
MRSMVVRSRRGAVVAAALIVALAQGGVASAAHAPGHLDRSFGIGGRVRVAFGGRFAQANAVAMQGRKALVAGAVGFEADEDLAVVRLTADGKIDRSFGGGDGRFVHNFFGDADIANGVAVLPDGKILVGGQAYDPVSGTGRFVALRLTPDGHLDHTFGGGDGTVVTKFPPDGAFAYAMTLLSHGRFALCGIVEGSPEAIGLAVYRPKGGLDRTFGTGGRVVTNVPGATNGAYCSALTHVGPKLAAVGTADFGATSSIAVAMYRSNGAPATGFDTDGLATFAPSTTSNTGEDVLALPDGRIVVAATVFTGSTPPDVALLRIRANGTPDPTFGGGDGVVIDDLGAPDRVSGIARQPDGKLLLVGFRNPDMVVARYERLGARDGSFGQAGLQATPWSSGPSFGADVVMARGRAVVVGAVGGTHSRFAIERVFT